MDIVKQKGAADHESKERTAIAAALVHDLGHGPLSHAFEKVGKRLKLKLADHELVSDLLIREGEVASALNREFGNGFAENVANVIKKDGEKTIHHAVVSSQFDADRLDYMRRDRLMCGTQHSAIDFTWLLANLEIGSVDTGVDELSLGKVETLVLGPKAIHAAEAYVLGLFQLYPTVYFHKATRGAEKLFTELLVQLVTLVQNNSVRQTGLPVNHPLSKFAKNPDDITAVLNLDDSVVWGALSQMANANDPLINEFSQRLRDRRLYKCIDFRGEVSSFLDCKNERCSEIIGKIDKCCASIHEKLTEFINQSNFDTPPIIVDDDERSPYKSIGESKGPLDRIHVRTAGGELADLKEQSSVVAALQTFKLNRAYVDRDNSEVLKKVRNIIEGEIGKCK